MTDNFDQNGSSLGVREIEEAAEALESLREPAERAAEAIQDAFGKAGESIARSLGRAAADGEISLAELARALLSVLNSAGSSGLSDAIATAVTGAFSGSRADGGPVQAGGAYLVGERGPEVFRPASGGSIEAVAGGVTVNFQLEGGAPSILRSESQIAQMLARAVALGVRRS
ncbi:phage tail tape measure protein [Brevundimonas sp. GCM10030266]|uniref:phage tail tape measure protein n=1 Tax=Brevundimonas sp. GCM10030266 TaxID=3273386 RepID=UPI00360C2716